MLKEYEYEYKKIWRKINQINEEIVVLLNNLEKEFCYSPFEGEGEEEVKKMWEKCARARNFEIY